MNCLPLCLSGMCGLRVERPPCSDLLTKLPPELTCMILRMLDPASLLSCAHVSKKWLALVRSDPVLRSRVRRQIRRQRRAAMRGVVSNFFAVSAGAVNVYVYQYDVGSEYGWSGLGVPERPWDISPVPPMMPVSYPVPRRRGGFNPATAFQTMRDAVRKRFSSSPSQSPLPPVTERRSAVAALTPRRRPVRAREFYVTSL